MSDIRMPLREVPFRNNRGLPSSSLMCVDRGTVTDQAYHIPLQDPIHVPSAGCLLFAAIQMCSISPAAVASQHITHWAWICEYLRQDQPHISRTCKCGAVFMVGDQLHVTPLLWVAVMTMMMDGSHSSSWQ